MSSSRRWLKVSS
jgi:NLI interacting factor-like phosphatase